MRQKSVSSSFILISRSLNYKKRGKAGTLESFLINHEFWFLDWKQSWNDQKWSDNDTHIIPTQRPRIALKSSFLWGYHHCLPHLPLFKQKIQFSREIKSIHILQGFNSADFHSRTRNAWKVTACLLHGMQSRVVFGIRDLYPTLHRKNFIPFRKSSVLGKTRNLLRQLPNMVMNFSMSCAILIHILLVLRMNVNWSRILLHEFAKT